MAELPQQLQVSTAVGGSPEPWGLSSEGAAQRLSRDGFNELSRARGRSPLRHFASQLTHFFAMLLWVAAGLAMVAGMLELGIAIALVVVVNGLFAFVQEHRADRAAQNLKALLPSRAVVVRDGHNVELAARELVQDDIIQLCAGDRVPADVVLVRGSGLLVDCATLTGESAAVSVAVAQSAFAGTFVVEGEAWCRVVGTGPRTRLSQIAELTQGHRRPTPLARELQRLVRTVALIAGGIGAAFFTVGAFVGLPLRDGFLFAIGVAVALVPEGLLPTVTLSLAMGAGRMAKHGALVRRLDAVEALGSTTFICSDKTGTLTRSEMNAIEVWTPFGTAHVDGQGYEPRARLAMVPALREPVRELALVAARCSSGRVLERDGKWVARGDPMEAALHALALRLGLSIATDEQARPERARFTFDPHRRRMSTVVGSTVYVKGAADSLLPACSGSDGAARAAEQMAARGLRVLAVARRDLATHEPVPQSAAELETGLTLLGLVGLFDSPRPEVREALAACHRAGMRVAIITGDHPGTAKAVAEQVGLRASLVVTGAELPTDDALLGALVDRDGVIACRVSPEQKLRIAKALQDRGHVVAMTGDGVNDGPALRQADVGIAMGHSGTDVARDAADLVLLDDRFETIVQAIQEGRSTFSNIRRFLTYHLTDNVSELMPFAVWALSGGRFPLSLGVLQILCLDLLSDQFPALALGAEPPNARTLAKPPPRQHLVDKRLLVRALCVLGASEAAVSLVAFTGALLASGWQPGTPANAHTLAAASGAAFLAIVFGQTATALACRSSHLFAWRVPLATNRLLVFALLVSWAIVALLICVPTPARLLGHAPPSTLGLGLALLTFPMVLVVDALYKWRGRRHTNQ